jgi:hypothetical protein
MKRLGLFLAIGIVLAACAGDWSQLPPTGPDQQTKYGP